MVRHPVATRTKPLDEPACLHDQLPRLGEQARQHLALGLFALGQEVVFFDRLEERPHLCEGRLGAHDRPRFELHQGAPTTLGPPPYDPGCVGIPNRQLLDSGIRGQDTDIGKPIVLGYMQHQPVDLRNAIGAQGPIGSGEVGVVSSLGVGIGLAASAGCTVTGGPTKAIFSAGLTVFILSASCTSCCQPTVLVYRVTKSYWLAIAMVSSGVIPCDGASSKRLSGIMPAG